MKERILAKLLELRTEDEPGAATFAAERSVSMMQAYCNREDLPEDLLGVGVELAGMLLADGIAAEKRAKSIKEGDVSVTFGEERFEGLPGHLQTELNRWRKLYR